MRAWERFGLFIIKLTFLYNDHLHHSLKYVYQPIARTDFPLLKLSVNSTSPSLGTDFHLIILCLKTPQRVLETQRGQQKYFASPKILTLRSCHSRRPEDIDKMVITQEIRITLFFISCQHDIRKHTSSVFRRPNDIDV